MNLIDVFFERYKSYNYVYGVVEQSGFRIPENIAELLQFPSLRWSGNGGHLTGFNKSRAAIAAVEINVTEKDIPETLVKINGLRGKISLGFSFLGCGFNYPTLREVSVNALGQTTVGFPTSDQSHYKNASSPVLEGIFYVNQFCTFYEIGYRNGASSFNLTLPKSPPPVRR